MAMTSAQRLAELHRLFGLMRDARLADLARARAAAEAVEAALRGLDDLAAAHPDPPESMAEAEAAARFRGWADARKAGLNLTLARRRADLLAREDAARVAFGRAEALRKLLP